MKTPLDFLEAAHLAIGTALAHIRSCEQACNNLEILARQATDRLAGLSESQDSLLAQIRELEGKHSVARADVARAREEKQDVLDATEQEAADIRARASSDAVQVSARAKIDAENAIADAARKVAERKTEADRHQQTIAEHKAEIERSQTMLDEINARIDAFRGK